MNTLTRLALASFLLVSTAAATMHPNLHQAADLLNRAVATHSLEDVKEARRLLHAAANAKDAPGHVQRKQALRNVEAALAALRTGKRGEAEGLIREALKDIEQAVARGKNH
jgi:hypothetical protein